MNIYISGITGTGMGPLAMFAADAGFTVSGSDLAPGMLSDELKSHRINFQIGPQDGKFLQQQIDRSHIDWFVYTSALPKDHPELLLAKSKNIKCTKRDEFTAYLIDHFHLKLVAVAGTHGKTTTTAMLIWACRELDIPASYIIGTTLGFAPAGCYDKNSEYFLYEADEYDRNFLHYRPWLSLIPSVSYDHPDIYPTKEDYQKAFEQFENQSRQVFHGGTESSEITLAGSARRQDATLALKALEEIAKSFNNINNSNAINNSGIVEKSLSVAKNSVAKNSQIAHSDIIKALNSFPGVGRRFERLATGIYTDYAHHPEEIAATVDLAREQAAKDHQKGVVIIYQPHQNTRQHAVRTGYRTAFAGVDQLFWLPTYLTREDPNLEVLKPEDFIKTLENSSVAHPADLNPQLIKALHRLHSENYLILLLSAGPADAWLRQNLEKVL